MKLTHSFSKSIIGRSIYSKDKIIEGCKYRIEVYFKATEAIEMIGMKMPE